MYSDYFPSIGLAAVHSGVLACLEMVGDFGRRCWDHHTYLKECECTAANPMYVCRSDKKAIPHYMIPASPQTRTGALGSPFKKLRATPFETLIGLRLALNGHTD
jgi:hypothetical protein